MARKATRWRGVNGRGDRLAGSLLDESFCCMAFCTTRPGALIISTPVMLRLFPLVLAGPDKVCCIGFGIMAVAAIDVSGKSLKLQDRRFSRRSCRSFRTFAPLESDQTCSEEQADK